MVIYVYNCDLRAFDAAQIIAQQCNCVTKTAKGLAASIIERFPYANFYAENPNRKPGTIELRGGDENPKRWIAAMYAQYYQGVATGKDGDSAAQRQVWFRECLERLGKVKNLKSVALPRKIGCGLAGGDWKIYRKMIEDWAATLPDVSIYIVSNECFEDLIISNEIKPKTLAPQDTHLQPSRPIGIKASVHHKDIPKDAPLQASQPVGIKTTKPFTVSYATTSLVDFTTKLNIKAWKEFFDQVVEGGVILELSKFLQEEVKKGKVIFPPLPLIYNVFTFVSPAKIKVVIVGQDPYHGEGQAMGISFSVAPGQVVPPSLRNIYKEMEGDGFTVSDKTCGDLTKWCQQGVFLVNTCLTVRQGEAGSHNGTPSKPQTGKWWHFTTQLFNYINHNCGGVVVIMWGNPARGYESCFDDNKHRKLFSVHPSPLSAEKGFFGSKPFSKANKLLKELGKEPVDWSL